MATGGMRRLTVSSVHVQLTSLFQQQSPIQRLQVVDLLVFPLFNAFQSKTHLVEVKLELILLALNALNVLSRVRTRLSRSCASVNSTTLSPRYNFCAHADQSLRD